MEEYPLVAERESVSSIAKKNFQLINFHRWKIGIYQLADYL
jgi:hypothetical protein